MMNTYVQQSAISVSRRSHWRPNEICQADGDRSRLAEVDAALEAWARWGRSLLQSIGWPSWTLMARIMAEGFQGAAQKACREFEVDEAMELMERAVLRLPEKERFAIIRHYTHYEPVEVSARYCSVHTTTFRTLLHRARRSIRDFLDGACVATKTPV